MEVHPCRYFGAKFFCIRLHGLHKIEACSFSIFNFFQERRKKKEAFPILKTWLRSRKTHWLKNVSIKPQRTGKLFRNQKFISNYKNLKHTRRVRQPNKYSRSINCPDIKMQLNPGKIYFSSTFKQHFLISSLIFFQEWVNVSTCFLTS